MGDNNIDDGANVDLLDEGGETGEHPSPKAGADEGHPAKTAKKAVSQKRDLIGGKYKGKGDLVKAIVEVSMAAEIPYHDVDFTADEQTLLKEYRRREAIFNRKKSLTQSSEEEEPGETEEGEEEEDTEDLAKRLDQLTTTLATLSEQAGYKKQETQELTPELEEALLRAGWKKPTGKHEENLFDGVDVPEIDLKQFGDPQKQLDEFDENPAAFIMKIVKAEAERQGKILGNGLTPLMKALLAEAVASKSQRAWDLRAKAFRKTHPDMDDYEDDIAEIYREFPILAAMTGGKDEKGKAKPDGLEYAYELAKLRRKLEKNQKEQEPEKRGLRVTGDQGPKRRVPKGKSEDEKFLDEVFK